MRQGYSGREQTDIRLCPNMSARVAGLIIVAFFLGEVAPLPRFAAHIIGCARR